nr:uncharacterized mitochondrial protein AtMg00810-like [Tanacetum cinerariifolium]
MASDHVSFDPVPQCQRTALEHDSLSPSPQCQENVPHVAGTVKTSNELDLLFSPMFDELLIGSTQVVSKSSAVTTADAPNKCQQQHTTPLNTQTTPEPTCQVPTQAPTVTSTENIDQAETITENAQVEDDDFINIFCTPVQDRGETSSHHPLAQVIGNPSQSVRTRRQLESDGEMSELARRNSMEYASKMEIECAQVRGDFLSYKMESQKSFKKYTQMINDLNQTILEMKNKLSAHQKIISILSQQKEAQINLYKTCEDKELDKVIALENKVKVLDNIVYKTDQSVQTMNMLNNKYRTSFAKPEFLKKDQRANPRLYDIGCYNDNLALMLSPESDEVIHLEKESRSKLIDLIRPFDYDKLNNLYDFFIPQREKSSEQRYFSKRSRLSHTPVNNGNSKESFHKQTTLLQKRTDESIPWDKKCKSSIELFKIKSSVDTIIDGVERCKETIAKQTYFGHIDPFIKNTIEANFSQAIRRINAGLEQFHFLNEIDRPSKEYYYADHMNAILGVYTELDELVEIVLFIVDSGCSKHMMGNLKLLINFVEKFLGTVKFGNDQIAPILGYGDLVQGAVMIKRVYYVEGMNHNLFSVGEFCDADLEVAFRKSTCYIRDLKGNDLLTGGDKLVSWSSKKQDCTSMSSAEAEYVSLSTCCTQVLWLRTQLTDYGFYFDKIPMYCDSKAAIAISCNPVQHSCTKRLGMRCLTPEELEVLANESA